MGHYPKVGVESVSYTHLSYRGMRGNNNPNFRGGIWKCLSCEYENYAIRTVCYRCNRTRDCQRGNVAPNQHHQQQRGGSNNRGGGHATRGRGGYNQAVAGPSTGN